MSEPSQSQQADSMDEDDGFQSKETSVLFAPFMIWILLACLLIAIWFKFLPLIIVTTFLFVLAVVIVIWKEFSLNKMQLDLSVPQSRVFAEENFTVYASVKNDKWFPLIWLEWGFLRSDLIEWENKGHHPYTIRFLWLLWYQQVKWEVKGKAMNRGVYDLGHVTLRSGDGFRFAEREEMYQLNQLLYIYPKLQPVQVPIFQPSLQWEAKGKQGGFLEDPLMINGVREYVAGDEWKHFNWRASARTGKLQTNVYQPIVSEQLTIYVDVEGFVVNEEKYADELLKQKQYRVKKEKSFEQFLSIIASTAVVYHERGMGIGYASNGRNYLGKRGNSAPVTQQLHPILDELAQLTQTVITQTMAPLEEIAFNGKRSVPLFIFCKKITNNHVKWYKQHERNLEIRFYYVYTNDHAVNLPKVAHHIDHLLAPQGVDE